MEGVFLCYRRGDAADVVGRIGDRLNQKFGDDFVFRDVDDIMPAANFRVAIADALSDVQCVLVAIGPDWLDAQTSDGVRRLEQPDDPVRTEIETAMSRGIPIIPLLVRGAGMPPKSALPGSIATLPDLNGLPIRPDPDFDRDVERLIGAIDQVRGESAIRRPPSRDRAKPADRRTRLLQGAGAAAVLALIAILATLALRSPVVPNLVGLNELQAADILTAAGIDITVRTEAADADQGLVISQEPESGNRAGSVVLVISEGRRSLVPDLRGRVGREAATELTGQGFSVDISERADSQPAGVVVDQFPEPGVESVAILLFVSSGPPAELPQIPALVGLSEAEARNAVPAGVSLTVELIEDAAAAGTVLTQSPPAGARAEAVSLSVSAGPGLPVLPTLVGLAETDAANNLAELGVAVSGVVRQPSAQPEGTVLEQDPGKGTRAAEVALVVSAGPGAAQFAATWENVDESGGLARLVVRATGDTTATVQGFGACTPTACDWGETSGTIAAGSLSARYDFGLKTTSITAELAGDFLVVTTFDDYAEGDTRSDRESQYVLTVDRRSALTSIAIAEALTLRPDLAGLFAVQPTLTPLVLQEDLTNLQLRP